MSAHTPGRWVASRCPCGNALCDTWVVELGSQNAWFSEADAYLISAAPDLLQIALRLDEFVNTGEPCCVCSTSPHAPGCAVVAALAKAEGR